MDISNRKYEPIQVEMIGLEDGVRRLTKDGHTDIPPLVKWRNNLTALSQYHNLFFVAQADKVAAYQPEFPYQTLSKEPVLRIAPELANPHANGYLSSARENVSPHCINHLMVGDLGSQEILALVTDSGNVIAYYTSSVAAAINRASAQREGGTNSDILGLRHFFSYWVRQSSWGLDIHKEARMIAVSSNVPNAAQPAIDADTSATVTVFAFALTSHSKVASSSSSGDDETHTTDSVEWTNWSSNSGGTQPRRDRNYKISLAGFPGHENNIPNISFVNTNDESEGWNVAALDINCFRPAATNEEFIGANKAPMYYGYHESGPSYNLTSVTTRLPENSQFHPLHAESTDVDSPPERNEVYHYSGGEDEDEDEEDTSDVEGMEDVRSSVEPSLVPDFDPPDTDYDVGLRDVEVYNRAIEFEIETDSESEDYDSDLDEDQTASIESTSPQSPSPLRNFRMQNVIRRAATPIQHPNIIPPEIAMIHCSDSHIRLLGSPKAKFPHIFSANVLRQLMPHNAHTHVQGLEFSHMDRLNMLHVIKELGVILIATQTGRVAVCALTRRPDLLLGFRVDCILPTKRQERSGRRPTFCTLIGMAVAPIQGRTKPRSFADSDSSSSSTVGDSSGLRFSDQHPIDIDGVRTSFDNKVVVVRHKATAQEHEAWRNKDRTPPLPKTETRPWTQLEETEEWKACEISRRYRLMLTYSDFSILTYEISRSVERGEIA
ncbi:hypothetical protein LTS08_002361 [Lithohypha guttulata]|nr:hypothetical protein LTS08_002361 [Lithohypha guttulata]